MNYFSHYYFFRHEATPYRALGMILPDIARFSEGKIPFSNDALLPPNNEKFNELFLGCKLHYDADKKFHASVAFKRMEQTLAVFLCDEQFNYHTVRRWFFNHVFAELIFDRMLIRKYPDSILRFYELLDEVESGVVIEFMKLFGRSQLDNFAIFFDRFKASKFLLGYLDDVSFLKSLNRTLQKGKQEALPEEILLPVLSKAETLMATFEQDIELLMYDN